MTGVCAVAAASVVAGCGSGQTPRSRSSAQLEQPSCADNAGIKPGAVITAVAGPGPR